MRPRILILLAMTAPILEPLELAGQSDGLPVPGRSVVATTRGIVATSHPLASAAGVQILDAGGNAIDAAIAANAAMGVMEPTGNGIGGDLFAIVYLAESNEVIGLNASGWAPAALTPAFLAEQDIDEMPARGVHTVTVPGVVAGWHSLRARYGRLTFERILEPAIHYAEDGFPLSPVTAGLWARSERMLSSHPHMESAFLIDGRTPRAGEVFRRPELATSLRRIAEGGRDGFYRGPTARAILAILGEHGGVMSAEDLAEYQPEWVEPISTHYRGWTVYEIPPNGQGIAALMMLDLMERFPIGDYGFHSVDALHVMIEAKKLAYADMVRYVGDPRFAEVPVEAMLNTAHAAERAERILMRRAACSVDPSEFPGVTDRDGGDTIYLTVIDEAGNIVSLIQSNYSGFGSGIVAEGTGFMLHNRGALFTLEEGHPNVLAGRKRPLHTIIPAFMERDGVRIGFGIMGGWNQAQAHAQFVSNIVDHGMDIQQALEAGRFTKGTFDGCDVSIESLVPESIRQQLERRGHDLQVVAPRSSVFGYGQAVMSTPAGVHFGASEPRHDGMAIPQGPPKGSSEGQR